MLSSLAAILLAASDPEFDALVKHIESRTGCEVQSVLKPPQDDYRLALFHCDGATQVGVMFQKSEDGWAVLARVFVGALQPVKGEAI
jgi:hypothetical protein